jgi:hypothetical protein
MYDYMTSKFYDNRTFFFEMSENRTYICNRKNETLFRTQNIKITSMGEIILKQEYSDMILNDAVLFGKVAEHLKTSVQYLPRMIKAKSPKLTQAGVLMIIQEYLRLDKSTELTCEMQEA